MMHYQERIFERAPDEAPEIIRRINRAATSLTTGHHAVYVYRLENHRGSIDGDYYARTISNGTLGVVIIRDGIIHTFMWRRDNQPATPDALRVQHVHHFKGV